MSRRLRQPPRANLVADSRHRELEPGTLLVTSFPDWKPHVEWRDQACIFLGKSDGTPRGMYVVADNQVILVFDDELVFP